MLRRLFLLVVLALLLLGSTSPVMALERETRQQSALTLWTTFLDWLHSLNKSTTPGGSSMDPDGGEGGGSMDPSGFAGGAQTQTTDSTADSDVGAQSDPDG